MTKTSDETKELHEILLTIGIPTHLLGYTYIIEALLLIISDKYYLYAITKRLYVDIARRCQSTPQRVERAMRHAIGLGFTQGNSEFIDSVFGNSVNPKKGFPSNTQFLSAIYFYMNTKGAA